MIVGFADKETEELFHLRRMPRHFPSDLEGVALRKLDMLNAANTLSDVRALPGNRLERLSGPLAGRYSIRVNDQWRIVFAWRDGEASQVCMVDYH